MSILHSPWSTIGETWSKNNETSRRTYTVYYFGTIFSTLKLRPKQESQYITSKDKHSAQSMVNHSRETWSKNNETSRRTFTGYYFSTLKLRPKQVSQNMYITSEDKHSAQSMINHWGNMVEKQQN